MEMCDWAEGILGAETLEDKLFSPEKLSDEKPRRKVIAEPVRPAGMGFVTFDSKKDRMPKGPEMVNGDRRAYALHRFCGHELLAVEIMANALLSFPNAPKHLRKCIANTLIEEQGHVRLYMSHLERFGVKFGDLPLFKHFWSHVPHLTCPLKYLSVMHLTLEMANLDFAPHYHKLFSAVGDTESANLMSQIFEDEISHVARGYQWLCKLKPETTSPFETYEQNLGPFLKPQNSAAFTFQKNARERAGLDPEWISAIAK
ncbi:MAG: DUF455 family protein [Simkaniaceae bacterium]|nr:DUF455 family protein [Simkaniaceae bacterium]